LRKRSLVSCGLRLHGLRLHNLGTDAIADEHSWRSAKELLHLEAAFVSSEVQALGVNRGCQVE